MRLHRPPSWLLFVALACCGCGSSRVASTGNTDEMKRVQTAFGDLQKELDTGGSKQEFAQKVNGTLARIGDLDNSERVAEAGLPEDKVGFVYGYFGRAAIAYAMSGEFFGDRWDDQTERTTDATSDGERRSVTAAFPEFYAVDVMSRRRTLNDLLKVAQDENHSAGEMIKTL
jgi:hypothetical protein